MTVPSAIVDALRAVSKPTNTNIAGQAPASRRIARGDIRLVQPPLYQADDTRLALVLRTEDDHNFAEIVLVHSTPELACHLDVVVSRSFGVMSYDVVLQTDLRGALWTNQVGRCVGQLSSETMEIVSQVALREVPPISDASIRPGSPLAGPTDRRWSFKTAEGRALRRLTADCTEALLSGGSTWEIDSGLLNPGLLDLVDDKEAFLLELMHLLTTRDLRLTIDDIETLEHAGVLNEASWRDLGLGDDIWRAFQGLLEKAATSLGSNHEAERRLVTGVQLTSTHHAEKHYVEVRVVGMKELVPA